MLDELKQVRDTLVMIAEKTKGLVAEDALAVINDIIVKRAAEELASCREDAQNAAYAAYERIAGVTLQNPMAVNAAIKAYAKTLRENASQELFEAHSRCVRGKNEPRELVAYDLRRDALGAYENKYTAAAYEGFKAGLEQMT